MILPPKKKKQHPKIETESNFAAVQIDTKEDERDIIKIIQIQDRLVIPHAHTHPLPVCANSIHLLAFLYLLEKCQTVSVASSNTRLF